MKLLREFKPALLFLAKFLAIYFAGNIIYGLYIASFGSRPDPVTRLVTAQSSWVLNTFQHGTTFENVPNAPKVALITGDRIVLNVFEGCNGINVMIVFVAFMIAFGGPIKALLMFVPAGLVAIHIFNLGRIGLLYFLALNDASDFYYYHKYFFTATLYLVVFVIWAIWVVQFNDRGDAKGSPS